MLLAKNKLEEFGRFLEGLFGSTLDIQPRYGGEVARAGVGAGFVFVRENNSDVLYEALFTDQDRGKEIQGLWEEYLTREDE